MTGAAPRRASAARRRDLSERSQRALRPHSMPLLWTMGASDEQPGLPEGAGDKSATTGDDSPATSPRNGSPAMTPRNDCDFHQPQNQLYEAAQSGQQPHVANASSISTVVSTAAATPAAATPAAVQSARPMAVAARKDSRNSPCCCEPVLYVCGVFLLNPRACRACKCCPCFPGCRPDDD